MNLRISQRIVQRTLLLLAFLFLLSTRFLMAQNNSVADINAAQLSEERMQDIKDSIRDAQADLRDSLRDLMHDRVDSSIDYIDKFSFFEAGLDYSNRITAFGRTYGNAMSFMPYIRYKHKSGFYAEFKVNYYYARKDTFFDNPISELPLGVGFERDLFENWYLNACYTHYFTLFEGQKDSTTLLNNEFALINSYNFFDYITAGVDFDFFFGRAAIPTDPGVTPKKIETGEVLSFYLRRDFDIYIKRKNAGSIFTIAPQFKVDVGSDNIADRLPLAANYILNTTPADTKSFWGLLDMEASVNVQWRIRNFEIMVTPRMATPFNMNQTAIDNKPGKPVYYVTASARYLLRLTKKKHKNTKP